MKSGSPVIRFRLKPELVAQLEEFGDKSPSAAAKSIVLERLGVGLAPVDLSLDATNAETRIDLVAERCPVCEGADIPGATHNPVAPYCTVGAELDEIIHAPLPDDLLDEAIEAGQEKSENSVVEDERPNPFTPRFHNHPNHQGAPTPAVEPPPSDDPLKGEWKALLRENPGVALEIGSYEEYVRRQRG